MIKLLAILTLAAAPAAAFELDSLNSREIASTDISVPAPAAVKADAALPVGHLFALTGPKALYTMMADTPAKFEEFKALWQPVIKKAGLKALPPEYSAVFGALKYETTGGLAIRNFLCDTAHMPVEKAEIERTLVSALGDAGLRVLGTFDVPVSPDIFPRPTVNVFYLTAFDANQDREKQLRYLGVRSEAVRLDLDVLRAAGAGVVAAYGGNKVFYIGPRIGVALAAAKDLAMAEKQAAYHKDLIAKRGEKLLAVRTDRLELTDGAAYLTKVYYLK